MKKFSTSLIMREMQIKTTMRHHCILVQMTINKKSTNNTLLLLVGVYIDIAVMENRMEVP